MARRTRLEVARDRAELARLNVAAMALERRAKFMAKYDATESQTKRRQPTIETGGEDSIYDQRKRTLGANIGRDLERNYAPARGILNQFRMNVVGALGKLQVNTEGGDEAAGWFNGDWAKDCDLRDDMHWCEVCQNVVAGVLREGDLLAVVDDGLIEDSGKLVHWESDQIAPLADGLLPAGYAGALQEQGILRDKSGKVLGYIVTGKHGVQMINDAKDATILPRDQARHIKNPWRMNQGRGVPALITNATNFLDLYEILGAELGSAKRNAVIAGFTKRGNAVTDWDATAQAPANLPENSGKATATTAAEGANSTDPAARNYERFENLAGGFWEYVDQGDEIVFPDIKRPNVSLAPFIEAVLCYAGASMGLARAYSLLRADSSYTSFRGDMILSWASAFYPMQKWLERRYADWVARKVLTWAQRKGKIKPLPAGWERTLSWLWPTMPAVNELEEEKGRAEALKNGTTDYSQLLGPDWRKRFAALAEQFDLGRELRLPLAAFEQKSGGAAPSEDLSKGTSE